MLSSTLDYQGGNIVFIVGCARSGTSWLQRLLASHPRVRTGQESEFFHSYIGPQLRNWREEVRSLSWGRGGVGLQCYLRTDEFMVALKEYMLKLMQPMIGQLKDSELFVEKSQEHSFWISEISELLPDSRFIHMLRDARDVVASLLAASRSWGAEWAQKSARLESFRWVNNVRAVRDAAKNLPKDKFTEVRYETLRASPERELRGLSDFLRLDWSDEQIALAVRNNEPDSFRQTGTKIPLRGNFGKISGPAVEEPEGFIRKAKAGSWKEDLSALQKFQVWFYARKTMKEMGYPWRFPF